MSKAALRLRPANPEPSPCKLCGGASRLFGVTDFNRNCEEARGKFLPLSGVAVYYRRCEACGLVYSEAFDDWAPEDFETHIYNAAYADVDGDYEAIRPASNAQMIVRAFGASANNLAVLDYGGGNGDFARALVEAGFRQAATYDAFHPDHRLRPEIDYDLITCFETLEHMPDPLAGAADIAGFLKPDGMVFFSTLTQPADFATLGMQWWYIGPRNGHVTLHSRQSLAILWARHGLKVASFNDNFHAAFRTVPAFASHLIRTQMS
ncbi:MAG TPA: class I SAM-dependent methyltransferase [Phenylobacterium sp.]|jgi:SAM-dependent methyltransferase|nr:class I SAM-dependent methyltransferase [Phenylobacterium sp.]